MGRRSLPLPILRLEGPFDQLARLQKIILLGRLNLAPRSANRSKDLLSVMVCIWPGDWVI